MDLHRQAERGCHGGTETSVKKALTLVRRRAAFATAMVSGPSSQQDLRWSACLSVLSVSAGRRRSVVNQWRSRKAEGRRPFGRRPFHLEACGRVLRGY